MKRQVTWMLVVLLLGIFAMPEVCQAGFTYVDSSAGDLSNRIFVVTGKPLGTTVMCEEPATLREVIAIDTDGGPALRLVMGFTASTDSSPGTRWVFASQSNCEFDPSFTAVTVQQ